MNLQATGTGGQKVTDEFATLVSGTTVFGTLAMLLANDLDPAGGRLEVVSIEPPAHGTLTQDAAGNLSYTPHAGFVGEDTLVYWVQNEQGELSQGTVHLSVVAPAPLTPEVHDEFVTVTAGQAVSGWDADLLANDTDPSGSPLRIVSLSDAQHGSLTRDASGMLTYKAAAGFVGEEVITYTVENAQGLRAEGKLVINVAAPVNTAPVVQDEWITIEAGSTVTGSVDQLLANDADPDGDTLTVELGSLLSGGILSQLSDGRIQFTAPERFGGDTGFTYTVSDGKGGTATATVHIHVVDPTNTAPVAQDDVIHVYAGQAFSAYVRRNDQDANNDGITITHVDTPSVGTATVDSYAGLWVDYQAPKEIDARTITGFSYTISDGRGGTSVAWCQVIIDPRPANPLTLVASNDTGASDHDGVTANNRPWLQLPPDAAIRDQQVTLRVNGANVESDWVDADKGIIQVRKPLPEGECQIAYGYSSEKGGLADIFSPNLTIVIDSVSEPPSQAPILLPEFDDGGQGSALIVGQEAKPAFAIGQLGSHESARLYVDGKLVNSSYNAQTGQLQMEQAFGPNPEDRPCQDHQITWTRVNEHGAESAPSPATVVGVVASWLPNFVDLLDRDDLGVSNGDGLTCVTTPRFFIGHTYLPPDVTIGLMVDGKLVASQWDAASGLVQVSTPLTDGLHEVVAGILKDGGFLQLLPVARLEIDTLSPLRDAPYPLEIDPGSDKGPQRDHLTCVNRPAMFHPDLIVDRAWHTEDFASAQLFVDGVAVASVWDKQKGTLTPVAPLPDGLHTFNFTVADAAGNSSPKAMSDFELRIDTQIPDVPLTAPKLLWDTTPEYIADPDASTLLDKWHSDGITSARGLAFSTTYHREELLIDGQVVACNVSHTWDYTSLTPQVPLTEGWHEVAVRAVSMSGATSQVSESLRIFIDYTAPDAPTSAPTLLARDDDGVRSDDGITSIRRPEFAIDPRPEGLYVGLMIDGNSTIATLSADGNAIRPYYDLSLGQHEVSITYVDVAGNVSRASKSFSISIVEPVAFNDLVQDTPLFGQTTPSSQPETAIVPSQNQLDLMAWGTPEKVQVWRGADDTSGWVA